MSKGPAQRAGKGTAPTRLRPEAPSSHPPEVVDPAWLAKAFLGMVLIALVCGYLTLCGLFYQGQWQLVLHPVRTAAAPPSVGGVPFESLRFGAGASGVPQLTGWWIPPVAGTPFSHLTVLYLPGGDGSLAADQATLASLHDLGVAVFAIDYRGYGQSADLHPSEQTMTEDAQAAWVYLKTLRGLPADRIILYGRGVGASLALALPAAKGVTGAASALILDQPDFDVEQRIRRDARSHLLPMSLLFHNRFALLPALDELKIPKLILSRSEHEDPAILHAADPKMTVALPPARTDLYAATIRRFLDEYAAPSQASQPVPAPARRSQ